MMNDNWIMHLIVKIEYQFISYLIWRLGTYDFISEFNTGYTICAVITLIARCMGPIWGPIGAHRTQVGHMNLAIWVGIPWLIETASFIWQQDVWFHSLNMHICDQMYILIQLQNTKDMSLQYSLLFISQPLRSEWTRGTRSVTIGGDC